MPEEPTNSYSSQTSDGAQGAAPGCEAEIESLRQALAAERSRAESYLASWQRVQADFTNYKRRLDQEREENARFAAALIIESLLPILDDMERALNHIPQIPDGIAWADGIRLIYRKLVSALEAQGLSPIRALAEQFNPAVHEAVAQGEGEEGIVVEEIRKGYKLHDRVLRPSLVVVGKGKE